MLDRMITASFGSDTPAAGYPPHWGVTVGTASGDYGFNAPPAMPVAEAKAAARLMGTSHEMLAELRACEDALCAAFPFADRIRDVLQPRIAAVRAVIAKAEGRS